jgi:hypothetical protein
MRKIMVGVHLVRMAYYKYNRMEEEEEKEREAVR